MSGDHAGVHEDRDFEQLARDLERLEQVTEHWPSEQRATVRAIRSTVEAIQVGAFRRLIRAVKADPGGFEALKGAVSDPWVRGVLTFNGLLRAPEPTPDDRVEAALESVRPMLASHGGDVQMVKLVSPSEVHIKLEGSCDGCSHSDVTVRQGIEAAIKEAMPSVERVQVVSGRPPGDLVQLPGVDRSPFEGPPWQDAGPLTRLSEDEVIAVELPEASVLLTLSRGRPRAFRNACAHLGMPLDGGDVSGGVLTCPYHGFQFALDSGACLTAPEVQLPVFPSRVEAGRVLIQVSS